MAAELEDLKNKIDEEKKRLAGGKESWSMKEGNSSPGAVRAITPRRSLKGHFGKIYAMHWAGKSEADKLVSASQDGKLIVWNALTTNKVSAIPLRSSWVMTCAFERETNGVVACGGLDNLCTIYKTNQADGDSSKAGHQELAHHDGYLSCCRFISANEVLTSSGDSTCILWDVESATPKTHFQQHVSDVMSVDISPANPNVFVSASCDSTCAMWDLRTGERINAFKGHESDVNSVAFFGDGLAFGSGSDDSSCRMFDTRSYNEVAEFSDDMILCGVTSVAFSSSGRLLFAGYDDYSLNSWQTIYEEKPVKTAAHDNRVSCLGVGTLGRAVCTGSWDTLLKVHA